jgi:hypothetical protein
MSHPHHALVRAFFDGLAEGEIPPDLLSSDMTVWTTTGGINPSERYLQGVKLLQSLFPDGLQYVVETITAEDDRAIAEVCGQGTLRDGNEYRNDYVFVFEIRDGRIVRLKEHASPEPIRTFIKPLLIGTSLSSTEPGRFTGIGKSRAPRRGPGNR